MEAEDQDNFETGQNQSTFTPGPTTQGEISGHEMNLRGDIQEDGVSFAGNNSNYSNYTYSCSNSNNVIEPDGAEAASGVVARRRRHTELERPTSGIFLNSVDLCSVQNLL